MHAQQSFLNVCNTAAFYIENIIYLFYKTSCLNVEVNCTEPSLNLVVPDYTLLLRGIPPLPLTFNVA